MSSAAKFSDTDWLLEEWGRWSRVNKSPQQKLPSATPVRRLSGSTLPSPVITDDEALRVDAAVAALVKRDPEAGRAVVMYYCRCDSVSTVARMMRESRWKVNNWILAGLAWLDGALGKKV